MLWLRSQILAYFILFFGLTYALLVLRGTVPRLHRFLTSRQLFIVSALMVGVVTSGCLPGAYTGRLVFQDEPTVLSTAAAELHGQPLYHSLQSPSRYSLLYGPMTYWVFLPPLLAGARNIRFLKLWMVVPLLLIFASMWNTFRRMLAVRLIPLPLLYIAVAMAVQAVNLWWTKGDAWLLLTSSVALQAALSLTGFAAPLVVGLCGAVLLNFKLTAVIFILAPVILLRDRLGWPTVGIALALSAVFGLAMFAIPGVSIVNYGLWLRAAAAQGFSMMCLANNICEFVFLLVPIVALYITVRTEHPKATSDWFQRRKLLILGLSIESFIALTTGAKRGAGPWHLFGLFPALAFVIAELLVVSQQEEFAPGSKLSANRLTFNIMASRIFVGVICAFALSGFKGIFTEIKLSLHGGVAFSGVRPTDAAHDLRSILSTHPGQTMAMGYGDDDSYDLTFERPLLIMAGQANLLDANAVAEMDLAGMDLPPSTLETLRECSVTSWILPHGGQPFSLHTYYAVNGDYARRYIFSPLFQQTFLANYRRTGQSRYYDLWTCARGIPSRT